MKLPQLGLDALFSACPVFPEPAYHREARGRLFQEVGLEGGRGLDKPLPQI